ncbi:hypothetical protein KFV02_00865 [Desulfohalobiaceae bacterium Ax17]|jgi:hypothetical protein|uniref:hypothetical protein n=1 Tax=Desulfovulcanus ferrireducens TaxID=2831190 RepID=UPI00207BAF58|nr:hypothetical protein [Desulfovulcanus ferrireducens]MBT8762482.1 hypothetical protein [Desulfovulcanus ferrireducens]
MAENNCENKCGVPGADDQKVMEERALSVFASERNEDLTALVLVMIVVFFVLLFTKWLA